MKTKIFPAKSEYLDDVIGFVMDEIAQYEVEPKTEMQLGIVIEEIFINIANYSYNPAVGEAELRVEVKENPLSVVIEFLDSGVPFDPLAREDADISEEATMQREGGLGIFIVKNTMDAVDYRYEDGKNILTIRKKLK